MTKLLLHVGYPKTGTTSLQRFMWVNRRLLRRTGVLYPETGIFHAVHYAFHKSIGYGEDKVNLQVPSSEHLLASLRREIEASSAHSVVMSSEYFIRVPPPSLKALFADFDTSIVVYLRRHDLLLDTMYIQRYKSGKLRQFTPMEKFIENMTKPSSGFPTDFLKALDRLADTFGQEKVIVRPFERGQNTPDLYHDFLRALGIEWDDRFKIPPREANPTVSNEILTAMDAVQLSDASDEAKRKATVSLVKLNNATSQVAKTTRITFTQRMRVIEMYAPSYATIAAKYLGRDSPLFHDPLPQPDETTATPGVVALESVVGLLLRALEPDILAPGTTSAVIAER